MDACANNGAPARKKGITNNQRDLEKNHPKVLNRFQVRAKDRKYQFWERNLLSIDLFTKEVFIQKMK